MKLLLDHQFSPGFADWINASFRGLEAVAARHVGFARAPDRSLYLFAREEGRVLITKDRDFLRLASELGPPPPVVLVRFPNARTAQLRAFLAPRLTSVLERVAAGDSVVLVD